MTNFAKINPERLWQRVMDLARFTDPELPWTRRAFTPSYLDGRAWLADEFEAVGLKTHLDTAGNLPGRPEGADRDTVPVFVGSHIDTVPGGGRFDGTLGVLSALEAVLSLREAGIVPRRPIEVVDFLCEEASEFGLSCIGSRALSGQLNDRMLQLARPDGITLAQAIRYVGGDPERLELARRAPDSIAAYLEVHIEQGCVLEASGTNIGFVTGIAGIRRERIVVTGRADHAGTTPMAYRLDALAAAARIIDLVYRLARERSGDGVWVVATIGRMDIFPNAANAVPGRVEMTMEVRSDDQAEIDRLVRCVLDCGRELVQAEGLKTTSSPISSAAPMQCDPRLQDAIETAASTLGQSSMRLPSGAGHDVVFVALLCPVGMIFTPCREGRSHSPDEWVDKEACAKGAATLLETLKMLAAGDALD